MKANRDVQWLTKCSMYIIAQVVHNIKIKMIEFKQS